MRLVTANNQGDLIGNTPLLNIPSLSQLTGCSIFVKCEQTNPGGSVKDRAALGMVQNAIANGHLRPGMTIVEGTAGNTGIGLAVVGKALGYKVLVVMPRGQTQEKQRMIRLHGAELKLVDPAPFTDSRHFYHTAKAIGENNSKEFWWANQFENIDNAMTHYRATGPEIFEQTQGNVDAFVSVSGTGGTIGGCTKFLKERNPKIKTVLVDPKGSGLKSYHDSGKFKSDGDSFTEGIGIMRLTANHSLAKIDEALSFPDSDIVTISRYIQKHDGIVLGSSGALNVTGALYTALKMRKNSTIVTVACDLGERSFSKLWNEDFLKEKGIDSTRELDSLLQTWKESA